MNDSNGTSARDTVDVRIGGLGPDDTDAVFALYSRCRAASPEGYLAQRTHSDFAALLQGGDNSVAVGAWAAGRLVGYSLCARAEVRAGSGHPLLASLGPRLWAGRGTVVDPAARGQAVAQRLNAERSRLLRIRGDGHMSGLIAIANLVSIAAALKSGAWLVGLEADESGPNHVAYYGPLTERALTPERVSVAAEDTEAANRLAREGWVGVGLEGSAIEFARLA